MKNRRFEQVFIRRFFFLLTSLFWSRGFYGLPVEYFVDPQDFVRFIKRSFHV